MDTNAHASRHPRHWAMLDTFDPADGTVIRQPQQPQPGYWVGAPSVTWDSETGLFYLVYRVRRPRGIEPDRGAEIHIARSHDGIEFETIWSATKHELSSTSIERCALRRLDDGSWVLYVSYVDPADLRWRTDLVLADQPDGFDLQKIQPVLTAADIDAEGVKDPFIFRVAGLYHMVLSYANKTAAVDATQLHGSADAYNTGLIRSASGLATSVDGIHWQWEGEIFGPQPDQSDWDRYCGRICTVWQDDGMWLALYDGAADVSENYEERVGLAFSSDLRTFHRVSRNGPLMTTAQTNGALRYFDVLEIAGSTYFYYEMALPDGSHDMRVLRR